MPFTDSYYPFATCNMMPSDEVISLFNASSCYEEFMINLDMQGIDVSRDMLMYVPPRHFREFMPSFFSTDGKVDFMRAFKAKESKGFCLLRTAEVITGIGIGNHAVEVTTVVDHDRIMKSVYRFDECEYEYASIYSHVIRQQMFYNAFVRLCNFIEESKGA